jgi:hypothetical protein
VPTNWVERRRWESCCGSVSSHKQSCLSIMKTHSTGIAAMLIVHLLSIVCLQSFKLFSQGNVAVGEARTMSKPKQHLKPFTSPALPLSALAQQPPSQDPSLKRHWFTMPYNQRNDLFHDYKDNPSYLNITAQKCQKVQSHQ